MSLLEASPLRTFSFRSVCVVMPGFGFLTERAYESEQMDDLAVAGEPIERALREIRYVNRFLGGHRALRRAIRPLLEGWRAEQPLRILDVGAGLGDYAVFLVRLGSRYDIPIYVTTVDANPAVVACARAFIETSLSVRARKRIQFVEADALATPFPRNAFHVATASLFLHHFDDNRAVELLRVMDRVSSHGIVINDLHRHGLAYAGIRALSAVLPVSAMFAHDGTLSVRRGFKPKELAGLARAAGLEQARLRRHWAFRLTLSTLPRSFGGT